jgi:hypothetical protein
VGLVPKSFNNYSTTNKYFSPKTLKVIDESGNIIIESIAGTSFCSMEYDSTGSLVMQWTGTILTSK